MQNLSYKRVQRVKSDDDSINAAIAAHWDLGGTLVDISFPAGMHWAVLVFAYPEHDAVGADLADSDEFACDQCGRVHDIEDSHRRDENLLCDECNTI